MIQTQCRCPFGTRSLLLAMLLVTAGLVWLRREVHGRLVLESDTGEIIISTSSPAVLISVDDDRAELELSIRAAFDRYAREHGIPVSRVTFTELESGNRRFLKYDYDRWVRRRFDIAQCRYVLDYSDAVARKRNEELAETIERVVKALRHASSDGMT